MRRTTDQKSRIFIFHFFIFDLVVFYVPFLSKILKNLARILVVIFDHFVRENQLFLLARGLLKFQKLEFLIIISQQS